MCWLICNAPQIPSWKPAFKPQEAVWDIIGIQMHVVRAGNSAKIRHLDYTYTWSFRILLFEDIRVQCQNSILVFSKVMKNVMLLQDLMISADSRCCQVIRMMIRIRIRISTILITNELIEEKLLFLRHLESSKLEQWKNLAVDPQICEILLILSFIWNL